MCFIVLAAVGGGVTGVFVVAAVVPVHTVLVYRLKRLCTLAAKQVSVDSRYNYDCSLMLVCLRNPSYIEFKCLGLPVSPGLVIFGSFVEFSLSALKRKPLE